MRAVCKFIWAAAVLCLIVPQVLCIPEMWVEPELAEEEDKHPVPGCLDHPTKLYGTHALGEFIAKDTESTVKFLLKGKATNSLCPGEKYTVEVTFPVPRAMLLTTTLGTLPPSDNPKWDGKCKGKRQLFGDMIGNTLTTTLDIPCDAAGKTLELKVTSSMGTLDGFHQITVTQKLASSGCGTCGTGSTGGETAPSPPTKPSAAAAVKVSDTCPEMKMTDPKCEKSSLGYGCAVTAGNTTIHVSYGTCVPSNPCTLAASLSTTSLTSNSGNTSAMNPTTSTPAELLHFAMEAPTIGYVSLGPAKQANRMPESDAVVAYVTETGKTYFATYGIKDMEMPSSSRYPESAGMVSYAGVVALSGGKTLICFARPLVLPAAKYTSDISLSKLHLNWAVGEDDVVIKHQYCGGVVLRFEEAAAVPANASSTSGSTTMYSGLQGYLLVLLSSMAMAAVLL